MRKSKKIESMFSVLSEAWKITDRNQLPSGFANEVISSVRVKNFRRFSEERAYSRLAYTAFALVIFLSLTIQWNRDTESMVAVSLSNPVLSYSDILMEVLNE